MVVKTWLREMCLGAHVSKEWDLRGDSLGFHYILEMLAQAASNPEIGHWPLRLGEISRPPSSFSRFAVAVRNGETASASKRLFHFPSDHVRKLKLRWKHWKMASTSSC